ncbi:MAG: hypothetical protein AB7I42_28460 [Bradyrhizobium sp.]|uniref:hypothetical protein n=1 Tax=Bradyrhizobium sp. TaxID=376 RepID=UPI002A2EF4E6|nr:hypothetical protein [Bradyrhizobium sp.]
MTKKPPTEFGRRRPSVPASPTQGSPSKRSHEVVLLVMGTIAVGSAAYALMPRQCTPAEPGTIPTVSSPSECPPRGSSSSSHGSYGNRYGYSSGRSSGSTAANTTDASSGGVRRGGFGVSARSFSSHFSFGS